MSHADTIFALASGAGTAGVAVVRVSGYNVIESISTIVENKTPLKPRYAAMRTLVSPTSGERLDEALVIYFEGPASFTGEDVLELNLHGGKAVVTGVLDTLAGIDGLRMAEPGEFTRRAFENGKMDLTQAEGLNDLIHAQTLAQKEQAFRQLDGELRTLYEGWRGRLVGHLAHLEADIDFPDEDLPDGIAGAVAPEVDVLKKDITKHLADGRRGEALRHGFRIVILGEPNAGKSTLMNAFARSDIAIVSDEAGTTRDALDVQLDMNGFPVRLIDTAGVRGGEGEHVGAVEREGIRRAISHGEMADLRLVLVRADEWPRIPSDMTSFLDERTFLVITQTDRVVDDHAMFHVEQSDLPEAIAGCLMVSVKEEHGLDDLIDTVSAQVEARMSLREAPALTRLRHRNALIETVEHLDRFKDNAGMDAVLAAEDVRMAARALGRITGRVDVEDVLDVVFSDFCIGK